MSDTTYVYKGKVKHCCKYCGRPVRFSENGELRSKSSSTVSVDEQGYAISLDDTCSECSVKVAKKAGKTKRQTDLRRLHNRDIPCLPMNTVIL